MARKRRAVCERCGRRFSVCRFNGHHQKFCTTAACVAERDRERKREHYRRKYGQDRTFREEEQSRCRDALQRRRERENVSKPQLPAPVLAAGNVELIAFGLVSQMIDSSDSTEVLRTVRRLERRGQRLAMNASPTRDPPI